MIQHLFLHLESTSSNPSLHKDCLFSAVTTFPWCVCVRWVFRCSVDSCCMNWVSPVLIDLASKKSWSTLGSVCVECMCWGCNLIKYECPHSGHTYYKREAGKETSKCFPCQKRARGHFHWNIFSLSSFYIICKINETLLVLIFLNIDLYTSLTPSGAFYWYLFIRYVYIYNYTYIIKIYTILWNSSVLF